ncbi:hypothetical protein CL632_02070 [bacterium]|jgi:protein-disulfide isomerase|nr:hypothetical protein [bacterium]MDP6571328.1 thioredoxin domain-containing protein [Patescibacteria group bacterium]MDP6756229.1 thioredoxin domain-containing protein [Patescibacteria group bacterium]|tara:strand:+ start:43582 stop:44328 length:747 start_codon:yes stop_codon:yes gene_type:complete
MALTSKQSFLAGIGSALVIFFIVGFFVLLTVVLKDDSDSKVANTGNTAVAGDTAPNQPSGQPPTPTEITLAPVTDDDWVRGNRNAKISLVEFSDYECPFCSRFHQTAQQVIDEYPDDVNWVYRHFPLTSIHPTAVARAEAAECAGSIGGNDAFWDYTDGLFENIELYGSASGRSSLAGEIALDVDKFDECVEKGTFSAKVTDQANQAVAAGGRGTPYSIFVAGDEKIPVSGAVPFSQIQAMVESLLNS